MEWLATNGFGFGFGFGFVGSGRQLSWVGDGVRNGEKSSNLSVCPLLVIWITATSKTKWTGLVLQGHYRTNTICSFYGTCPARLAGLTSGKNLPIRKQRQFFRKKENATFLFSIFKFCCVILIYSILLWCFIWTSRERVHKKPGKNPKVCVWGNFEWGKKHWNHALWPL